MSDPAVAETPDIEAVLTYAVDTGEKIINETMGEGDMGRRRTGIVEERTMPIRNGRPFRDTFDLETHGFEFVDHPTAMKDFFDPDELRDVYYREAEELVKEKTGAKRVHVFDHTLRSGDEDTRNEKLVREPVTRVHNDYTEWSGPNRVRDLLPDEAEDLLTRRFPRMARDEALVFKVFDSATDGRARFTAHSAFADPTSPPDAAPRESIEMRTIAFF